MAQVVLLTGPPRIGKTTVLCKTADELAKKGFTLGGMVSQEAREDGNRVGFKILDYLTGNKGWLAHKNQKTGPKIGKYRVNLYDLNNIGVNAVLNALRTVDIILIDEIGPMELFSTQFKRAVYEAVNSSKMVLGTIHLRAKDNILKSLKLSRDTIIEVSLDNRDILPTTILHKILEDF